MTDHVNPDKLHHYFNAGLRSSHPRFQRRADLSATSTGDDRRGLGNRLERFGDDPSSGKLAARIQHLGSALGRSCQFGPA